MALARWIRDRWFHGAIKFFVGASLISLTVVLLSGVVQITALGAVALAASVLGLLLCVVALRLCHPLQWHGLMARLQWRARQVRVRGERIATVGHG